MKRIPLLCLAAALVLPLAGCPNSTAPTPPLAPGYLGSADQQMGEILAGAHSFYVTIQTESASGQMTLTATQKAAFNTFGVALNSAQMVYLAYHANPTTANLTAAQAAVAQVQTQQAALPLPQVTK